MGTKHSNIIWNFFAMLHGKGTVDGLGGAVKCSLWRFVNIDSNAPLDAMSYLEIAGQCNANINIFFISSERISERNQLR